MAIGISMLSILSNGVVCVIVHTVMHIRECYSTRMRVLLLMSLADMHEADGDGDDVCHCYYPYDDCVETCMAALLWSG